MQFTKQKIVLSGHYLEHEIFEIPIVYGTNYHVKKKRTGITISDPKDNEIKSAQRAKATVRRLVYSNDRKWLKPSGQPCLPQFITLTFKLNITSLDVANEYFSQFIQRLNYFVSNGNKKHFLQYISVTEFQDENRDGVIHFHVLFFNLRYIHRNYDEIKRIWTHGHVHIKSVKNVKNLGSYLVKYMVKSMQDGRLSGRKKYTASHGLFRPYTIYEPDLVNLIVEQLPKSSMLETASWSNKFCKSITRTTYNLFTEQKAIAWVRTLVLR